MTVPRLHSVRNHAHRCAKRTCWQRLLRLGRCSSHAQRFHGLGCGSCDALRKTFGIPSEFSINHCYGMSLSDKCVPYQHWANADPFSLVEKDEEAIGEADTQMESSPSPLIQSPAPPAPRRTRKELSPARLSDSPQPSSTARYLRNRNFPPSSLPPASYDETGVIGFPPLPAQSVRTALFLDRFSQDCPITFVSNDNFVETVNVMGRPFFDFVARRDEELVRSWIEAVKTWGVNERGQPSDGGFGYGKFHLYLPGRDSRCAPVSHDNDICQHSSFGQRSARRASPAQPSQQSWCCARKPLYPSESPGQYDRQPFFVFASGQRS